MTPFQIFCLCIIAMIFIFTFTVFTGAPFVPSRSKDLEKLFTKDYKLSRRDLLIDLGAGNGKVLKYAAKSGAKLVGIELNPFFALLAKFNLRKFKNAHVYCKNFYNFKFPLETTVIYIFGDSRDIKKIFEKIEQEARRLNKDLDVISLAFPPDGYKPVKTIGVYYLYKIKH